MDFEGGEEYVEKIVRERDALKYELSNLEDRYHDLEYNFTIAMETIDNLEDQISYLNEEISDMSYRYSED